MATIATYSKDGKKSGTISVPKILVDAKVSHPLLHQVAIGLQANARRATAHTKGRGEIRGGGRKPWRQKGTGRARAGSSRSPLWRGGGITFGPTKHRNYGSRITSSARRVAFRQVLAQKIRDGEVFIISEIAVSKPKTKLMETFLQHLPLKEGQILLVLSETNESIVRATANISYASLKTIKTIDVLDLLNADSVVMTKDALAGLEQRYGDA